MRRPQKEPDYTAFYRPYQWVHRLIIVALLSLLAWSVFGQVGGKTYVGQGAPYIHTITGSGDTLFGISSQKTDTVLLSVLLDVPVPSGLIPYGSADDTIVTDTNFYRDLNGFTVYMPRNLGLGSGKEKIDESTALYFLSDSTLKEGDAPFFEPQPSAYILKNSGIAGEWLFQNEGGNIRFYNHADGDFNFTTGNRPNTLFINGGNAKIGMGTNDPDWPLHVMAPFNLSATLKLESTNNGVTNTGIIMSHHDTATWNLVTSTTDSKLNLYFDSLGIVSNDVITFDSDGSVTLPSVPSLTGTSSYNVSMDANGKLIPTEDVTPTIDFFNGTAYDSPVITVTSNGTTVSLNIEASGGGDVRFKFSDGLYTLDCTPIASVALTAGTDTVPTLNYVYVDQATKTLTASTSGWPSGEIAPVATVVVQSAASVQTDGAYKVHAWTDHVEGSNGQGHLMHLNYWIRDQEATWNSGVALTPTAGAGQLDIATASGVVLQLHTHAFPAFNTATGSDVYVINHPDTAYRKAGDLLVTGAVDKTTDGTALGGAQTDFYNIVIWGVVSEDASDCKLMVNLPSGAYGSNVDDQAILDIDQTAVYTIPSIYRGTGFLIARLTIQENAGSYTVLQNEDLRGLKPTTAAGSTGSGGASLWSQIADTIYYNSGYVGIGTTSPEGNLTIYDNTDNWVELNLKNTVTTDLDDSGLSVRVVSGTSIFESYDGGITFRTNASDAWNIGSSSGNLTTTSKQLGIGIPSPEQDLHLYSNTGTGIYLESGTGWISSLELGTQDNKGWILQKEADTLDWIWDDGIGQLTKMSLVDDDLTIGGTTQAAGQFVFRTGGAAATVYDRTDGGTMLVGAGNSDFTGISFNQNDEFQIRSGTNSNILNRLFNAHKEIVIIDTTFVRLFAQVEINNNTGNAAILDLKNDTHNWRIQTASATNNDFVFRDQTNAREVMRFDDATGYVGIGTTSPNYELDIQSTDGTVYQRNQTNDGGDGTVELTLKTTESGTTNYNVYEVGGTFADNTLIDIVPVSSATGSAHVRLFRNTNTTGPSALQIHRADGTSAVNTYLNSGGGASYINAYGGKVGIGNNNPETTLHVYDTASYQPQILIEHGATTAITQPYMNLRNKNAGINDYLGTMIFQGPDNGGTARNGAWVQSQIRNKAASNIAADLAFVTTNTSGTNNFALVVDTAATIRFGAYGTGNKLGTAAYNLGVDANGYLVTSVGGGGGSLWTADGSDIYYASGDVEVRGLNQLVFENNLADKIVLWGSSYKIGIAASDLQYTSGADHSFYTGLSENFEIEGDGDVRVPGDLNVGDAVGENSYTIHAVHPENHAGFYFQGPTNLTGAQNLFVIEDNDPGGGGQDHSSVLRVVKNNIWNASDYGSTLIELDYTGTALTDDGKWWIRAHNGNGTDAQATEWGVDQYGNHFYTTGGIVLGAVADGTTGRMKPTIANTSPQLIMAGTGNPRLSIVADQLLQYNSMIVNEWGNSSNPGISIGTTRSDGDALRVVSGVSTDSDGVPSSAGTERFVVEGDGSVLAPGLAEAAGNLMLRYNSTTGEITKYSYSRIKILPTDFMSNDDNSTYGPVYDDTDNGVYFGSTSLEAYVFVEIPEGYTATHVMIYGANTDAVTVYEQNINSSTRTSKGSGNTNTEINITDVAATTTNYLVIYVGFGSSSDNYYGGYVTITPS